MTSADAGVRRRSLTARHADPATSATKIEADKDRGLRVWTAAKWVAAFVYGIVIVAVAATQWLPGHTSLGNALSTGHGAAGVAVPLLALMAACAIGVASHQSQPGHASSFPATLGIVAGTAFVLGVSAFLPCSQGRLPVWSAISGSLAMMGGDLDESVFRGGGLCPARPPLSARLGFLLAQVSVVAAGAGVVTAVFSQQIARMRALHGRAIIVVGVDDEALPLIARLPGTAPGHARVIVVDNAISEDLASSIRAQGGLPVEMPVDDAECLESLLIDHRSRWRFNGLYFLDARSGLNLERLATAKKIVSLNDPLFGALPPRCEIRMDDPFQAEDWRRRQMPDLSQRWLFDAQSILEATADAALDEVEQQCPRNLVISGDSPFALALVSGLSLRARQAVVEHLDDSGEQSCGTGGKNQFHVTLAGSGSRQLARMAGVLEEHFGNESPAIPIVLAGNDDQPAMSTPGDFAPLAPQLDDGCGVLILADEDPGAIKRATEIAAAHPQWHILAWDPDGSGISPVPVMGDMHTIGATFDRPADAPLDTWERLGMMSHQRYLNSSGNFTPGHPARGAWPDLTPFTRGSNIRQVFTTLTSVAQQGLSWAPAGSADETFAEPLQRLSKTDIENMAKWEHAAWCDYHTENGWKWGPSTDPGAKAHSALVPWDELTEELRGYDRSGVRSVLTSLGALGYRVRSAPDEMGSSFRRRGTVHARRIWRARRWHTARGDMLRARRGDWLVDDGGRSWTVRADLFGLSYEHLTGRTWRASGTVTAHPAVERTVITTLEGPATAEPGDWIVEGTGGERWPVTANVFWNHYERA